MSPRPERLPGGSGSRLKELYDAVYLEIAQRRTLPRATLDEDVCAACAALGLGMLGIGA